MSHFAQHCTAMHHCSTLRRYIVSPTEDTVTFEAHMAESSMPQIVLAVGIPRAIRQLKDSATDVATYTKKMGGGQVSRHVC